VVAGRDRDDAPGAFLGGQRIEPGEGAAWLEGAGLLEMLGLEVDPLAREPDAGRILNGPRRGPRDEDRRAVDAPGQPFGGGRDRLRPIV